MVKRFSNKSTIKSVCSYAYHRHGTGMVQAYHMLTICWAYGRHYRSAGRDRWKTIRRSCTERSGDVSGTSSGRSVRNRRERRQRRADSRSRAHGTKPVRWELFPDHPHLLWAGHAPSRDGDGIRKPASGARAATSLSCAAAARWWPARRSASVSAGSAGSRPIGRAWPRLSSLNGAAKSAIRVAWLGRRNRSYIHADLSIAERRAWTKPPCKGCR